MEVSINKMTEKQMMMMEKSVKVCSYCYYCVRMMWENDEDEMVINQMNLVDHEEMDVVAVERN